MFRCLNSVADRGFSPRARHCHGNRLQGGDLQQGFMIDISGVGEEQRGQSGEEK